MYLSALERMGAAGGVNALAEIPEGKQGTFVTLRAMANIVKTYKKDPSIRDIAIQVTSALAPKDYAGEVDMLFRYVRDNIRYIQDISGVETIHTPDLILQQGAGDCDDKSILLCTLLECINHKSRFCAVGFDGNPENFSHVYVESKIGQSWVPLDPTENFDAGWFPPGATNFLRVYN